MRMPIIRKIFKLTAALLAGMAVFSAGAVSQQLLADVVNYKIVVDGREKQIDQSIVAINDRTYVPLRALAEVLGMQVDWDEHTQTVNITPAPEVAAYEPSEEELDAQENWLPFKKDGMWGFMDENNFKEEISFTYAYTMDNELV